MLAFQRSEGLLADGVIGPRTAAALGLSGPTIPSVIPGVTVDAVCRMFPSTPVANVKQNLPVVLQALVEPQLTEKPMVLMALATIRAETVSHSCRSPRASRDSIPRPTGIRSISTTAAAQIWAIRGLRMGPATAGRGFIQLTGRTNYQVHGAAIGLGTQLIENPEMANDPAIAARLLASFIKSKERQIKEALLEGDLRAARKLVNGGSHGLDRFTDAFRIGDQFIAAPAEAAAAKA